MDNFDGLKDKVLSRIGKAADMSKGIAEKAAEKTKAAGKLAKLNIDISTEKDNLRKAYGEIGKLYYDTHKDAPEGFFVQMFEEVEFSLKTISEKEAEIAELKASKEENDIEVEFEEIVAEEENKACCGEDAAPAEAHDDTPSEE